MEFLLKNQNKWRRLKIVSDFILKFAKSQHQPYLR